MLRIHSMTDGGVLDLVQPLAIVSVYNRLYHIVSASFACAINVSANVGTSLVSGQASGSHNPERIMHFGQWESTRSTSTTST
jgi:hypothetical protein